MESDKEQFKRELRTLRMDQEHLQKRIERLEEQIEGWDSGKSTMPLLLKNKIFHREGGKQTDEAIEQKAKHRRDLEVQIGGTWLNRIGVVAVVFGLAYFLKYSFDNQWIGPTGRVIIGVLIGLLMMGTGEKLQHRYAGYSQGLLGGGSLAIFFSIFASYQFYQLITALYAFFFLILVMAATVLMALRHNSIPIGILGIIGGYLTPFMIGSDDSNLWTLFSYLALLTAGVLVISIFKKWPFFQYLSFFFNQVIFLLTWFWVSWDGKNEDLLPLVLFLIYNFLLYLGVATIFNIRRKIKASLWDTALIVLNAFAFFAFSLLLMEDTWMEDYLGFYAVFLSVVYIYLGRMAYKLYRDDKAQVYSLFLVSFVLVTIAVPLQLADMYIPVAWLAEAVGLAYMSKQLMMKRMYYSALLVFFLGIVTTFHQIERLDQYETFLFNSPTLLLLGSLLSTGLMIRLGTSVDLFGTKVMISTILKAFFLIWLFYGLTIQNYHFFLLRDTTFFLSPEQLSLSGIWLLYASALFIIGMRRQNRFMRYAALIVVAMVIVKAFFIDLAQLAAIFKILLFILLGLFLLVISYFYQKKKELIQEEEM
jgi:uncharacterized membrane protein